MVIWEMVYYCFDHITTFTRLEMAIQAFLATYDFIKAFVEIKIETGQTTQWFERTGLLPARKDYNPGDRVTPNGRTRI